MHAVTMASVLRQQNSVIPTNGDDDARGDLRVVALPAVAAQHGPLGFALVHGVSAVAAELMGSEKFCQLHATPGQLEQTDVQIDHLANRSHFMMAMLLDQPHGIALPFAEPKCPLPRKIETSCLAVR
ncbi:hypothetical protein D3C72_788350 [compost metagenome]